MPPLPTDPIALAAQVLTEMEDRIALWASACDIGLDQAKRLAHSDLDGYRQLSVVLDGVLDDIHRLIARFGPMCTAFHQCPDMAREARERYREQLTSEIDLIMCLGAQQRANTRRLLAISSAIQHLPAPGSPNQKGGQPTTVPS